MEAIIATLKEEAYGLIPSLYADSFEDTPWPDNWFSIDKFDHDANLLACLNDTPVGFLVSFMSKDLSYISVVGVKQSKQGLGIGRKLITHAIGYWEEKGYRSIRIHVDKKKQYVQAFYESLGFVIIHEDDEDFEMILEIQEA